MMKTLSYSTLFAFIITLFACQKPCEQGIYSEMAIREIVAENFRFKANLYQTLRLPFPFNAPELTIPQADFQKNCDTIAAVWQMRATALDSLRNAWFGLDKKDNTTWRTYKEPDFEGFLAWRNTTKRDFENLLTYFKIENKGIFDADYEAYSAKYLLAFNKKNTDEQVFYLEMEEDYWLSVRLQIILHWLILEDKPLYYDTKSGEQEPIFIFDKSVYHIGDTINSKIVLGFKDRVLHNCKTDINDIDMPNQNKLFFDIAPSKIGKNEIRACARFTNPTTEMVSTHKQNFVYEATPAISNYRHDFEPIHASVAPDTFYYKALLRCFEQQQVYFKIVENSFLESIKKQYQANPKLAELYDRAIAIQKAYTKTEAKFENYDEKARQMTCETTLKQNKEITDYLRFLYEKQGKDSIFIKKKYLLPINPDQTLLEQRLELAAQQSDIAQKTIAAYKNCIFSESGRPDAFILSIEPFAATVPLNGSLKGKIEIYHYYSTINYLRYFVNEKEIKAINGVAAYTALAKTLGKQSLSLKCVLTNPATGAQLVSKRTYWYTVLP
jgi:hypothetical protein